MHVKWVCGECNSNNLQKKRAFLRCAVCGKLRTNEPIRKVKNAVTDAELFADSVAGDLPALTAQEIFPFLRYQLARARKAAIPSGIAVMTLLVCYGIYTSPTIFLDNMRQYITILLPQKAENALVSMKAFAFILMKLSMSRKEWMVESITRLFSQKTTPDFQKDALALHALGAFDRLRDNYGRMFAYARARFGNIAANLGVALAFWKANGASLDDVKQLWGRVKSILLRQ